MVEAYLRQSALAHLGLEGRAAAGRGEAGVAMTERPHRAIVNLRLDPGNTEALAAFEAAFGFALPIAANDTAGDADTIALWLGPDEWWLVEPGPEPEAGPKLAENLRAALTEHVAAITEVGGHHGVVLDRLRQDVRQVSLSRRRRRKVRSKLC